MKLWLLVRSIFWTIVIPGSVVGWAPILVGGGFERWPAMGTWQWIALVPLAFGFSIGLWAIYDFFASGRGTLAPIDPPKELVVRGPYRFVRNPMYSAAMFVNLGWALLFQSWSVAGYGVLVWLMHLAMVVLYEEPVLKRKFGASYEAYLKTVNRWIPST